MVLANIFPKSVYCSLTLPGALPRPFLLLPKEILAVVRDGEGWSHLELFDMAVCAVCVVVGKIVDFFSLALQYSYLTC